MVEQRLLNTLIFCLCAAETEREFNVLRENYREKVDSSLWKTLASQNVVD